MIKIGILGDIGSGKSFVAKEFGYPVFNADYEVSKLYQKDNKIFKKLKKILPKYINVYPINKNQITASILSNKSNLKKIVKIVHSEVRKKMWLFIKKNKNKKVLVFDIPLLLENKISDKSFVLVFVDSKKKSLSVYSGCTIKINEVESRAISEEEKKYKVNINESWFIRYNKGGIVYPHHHDGFSWSCVYYVQVGADASIKNGSTYFKRNGASITEYIWFNESMGQNVIQD